MVRRPAAGGRAGHAGRRHGGGRRAADHAAVQGPGPGGGGVAGAGGAPSRAFLAVDDLRHAVPGRRAAAMRVDIGRALSALALGRRHRRAGSADRDFLLPAVSHQLPGHGALCAVAMAAVRRLEHGHAGLSGHPRAGERHHRKPDARAAPAQGGRCGPWWISLDGRLACVDEEGHQDAAVRAGRARGAPAR
ncbi:hypothetical protein D9M70_550500 [compost metagenome]